MKSLFLSIALALSLFAFGATVQASEGYEGFAPVADHSAPTVAVADCDGCMYATETAQRQPEAVVITADKPQHLGIAKLTNSRIGSGSGDAPYEVGWRS